MVLAIFFTIYFSNEQIQSNNNSTQNHIFEIRKSTEEQIGAIQSFSKQQDRAIKESTEKQLAKMQEQIDEMKVQELRNKRDLIDALIVEIEANKTYAKKVLATVEKHLLTNNGIIVGMFPTTVLNANLLKNTISEKTLVYRLIWLKNLYIICNQDLEYIRSGRGRKTARPKRLLVEKFVKNANNSNIYPEDRAYLNKIIERLPDPISIAGERMLDVVWAFFDNSKYIEETKKELEEYSKGLAKNLPVEKRVAKQPSKKPV